MKKVIYLDGGAGRIIAAIPALEKYARNNPNDDWAVLIGGWDALLWGNPLLQDRVYSLDTKGVFDNIVKNTEQLISPEPYRNPAYFRQEISMVQAFDREINNTTDHSDLGVPKLYTSQQERLIANNTFADLKAVTKKQKTIVIQPFGRGAKKDRDTILDEESRSLSSKDYLFLAKKLSQKYNLIFFGEPDFQLQEDQYAAKYTCDLRQWMALIENADYFLGVDSVGQHMARALNIPGTIIFGSTFPINTSYPDFFQIIDNGATKKYSPIRITGLDTVLSHRLNESTMKYTEKELTEIYNKIISDIDKRVK